MKSTTRMRKTIRPLIARLATWSPQLAPTSWVEILDSSWEPEMFAASAIAASTVSASSLDIVSVWTRIDLPPRFTIGELACSTPESATASRILSTVSWLSWSLGTETEYSTPPSNSMPKLSGRTNNATTETARRTPDIAYHVHLRPTKSTDFRPSYSSVPSLLN